MLISNYKTFIIIKTIYFTIVIYNKAIKSIKNTNSFDKSMITFAIFEAKINK